MVFVLLLVQSKGSLECKTIFLKTFGNLYVFNFMKIYTVPVMESVESSGTINHRLIVDNLWCVMEPSTTSTLG